ncbi:MULTISPECIES: hypothetical protein [unclassified Kutzneria]|uniref:hypothetical protein n=1 Tax=unclassified Kutzneria TaxID=2621979 RepID=UPI0003EEA754|nr:hypothetical protein [Kutzneria sp. 744]EWM12303.1 hypothetical protein KUTG_02607 [Kutzneria sp. 744]
MAGAAVANLLLYLVLTMVPAAFCWLILQAPRIMDWFLVRRRGPSPTGPSIQFLAQRLRHVHRTLLDFEPGTPAVRRYAARQAYDDLLRQACHALDIDQHLDDFPEGMDKEIERLRVEESLRRAGLHIP